MIRSSISTSRMLFRLTISLSSAEPRRSRKCRRVTVLFCFCRYWQKQKLCNQGRLEVETEPEIPESAVLEPEPEPVAESEEEADFKSGDNNK